MRRSRWLAEWRNSETKPVFYHCISRVVERRFALGATEKEKFRSLMRMMERFSGCRVVSYCLMCNHIHLLLEVPPIPPAGLSDAELLKRLRGLYNEAFVTEVAAELAAARAPEVVDSERAVAEIHARFTYRMHDLGQFMKTLLQRFSQWFNRIHSRTGTLWEDRYKSVIVEDGVAAKAMAAYIDLNPVRAGMVSDPANYRWSSYGEAIGSGPKGNGKTARAGLVRALKAHQGTEADAEMWVTGVSIEYRKLLMAGVAGNGDLRQPHGSGCKSTSSTGQECVSDGPQPDEQATQADLPLSKALGCRIRYFTDGAVIGSRSFVDEAFAKSRERFGPKRRSGARKLKGNAAPASAYLWSIRDLRKGIV